MKFLIAYAIGWFTCSIYLIRNLDLIAYDKVDEVMEAMLCLFLALVWPLLFLSTIALKIAKGSEK